LQRRNAPIRHFLGELAGDIIGEKAMLAALAENPDEVFDIFLRSGFAGEVNEIKNVRFDILRKTGFVTSVYLNGLSASS
jgi:hypothetical protein